VDVVTAFDDPCDEAPRSKKGIFERNTHMKSTLNLLIAGLCLTATLYAGDLKIEPDQKYLMLDTTKTSTMQKELTEAAGQGFRVVVGGVTSSTNLGILMERAENISGIYEYRLLATSKAKTMMKEMNESGSEGFRLIPTTLAFKQQMLGAAELVLVMERAPQTTKHYEYQLFSGSGSENSIRDKLGDAIAEGYMVVGLAMTAWAGAQVITEQESEKVGIAE
jgi:hypothetical protein